MNTPEAFDTNSHLPATQRIHGSNLASRLQRRLHHATRATTAARPLRILFVFGWLVVGGEETELRLLAKHLNPARYQLEVLPCLRREGMPEQTHLQLQELGIKVDTTAYPLSFDDTVAYLGGVLPQYDVVVACQAVPDVYPALEQLTVRPPLIEHGGLVEEALRGPKHFTARYVGVCNAICAAAAGRMPERPHHVVRIPSMVDMDEFDPAYRAAVRAEWQVDDATPVIGWIGRLDRKKRVEDFIRAAALTRQRHPRARFVVIGGPDAFMPEYAQELYGLAETLGLRDSLHFLGDRADVPRLLAGLDIFVWLSRGEGMPHVISEAGAAGLPVIATRDNGVAEQIRNCVTGLFVPYESPQHVATALDRLICDPDLRARLGGNLRRTIEREFSTRVLVPRWETLFQEVAAEHALLRLT